MPRVNGNPTSRNGKGGPAGQLTAQSKDGKPSKGRSIPSLPDSGTNGKPPKFSDLLNTPPRLRRLDDILKWMRPAPKEWMDAERDLDCKLETVRLSDVKPESLSWIWDQRLLLGKLNIVYGDPGLGKTTLVLDILAHVTTGEPFCDGAECEKGEVLFVTAEDGIADTVRPRMEVAGADLSSVHVIKGILDVKGRQTALDLEKHTGVIEAYLSNHPGIRVVALDPLAAFLGKIDSHRNNEVRAVLGRLNTMAEKRRVAILMIDHLTKGGGKALYRGIGSIAFSAGPRAVWHVVADPDDPQNRRLFLNVKKNHANAKGLAFHIVGVPLDGIENDVGRIVWEDGEVTETADEVAEKAADTGGATARAEAKEWLCEMLKHGPCPSKDIARMWEEERIASKRTLEYAKKELKVISRQINGQWCWMLTEQFKKLKGKKGETVKG